MPESTQFPSRAAGVFPGSALVPSAGRDVLAAPHFWGRKTTSERASSAIPAGEVRAGGDAVASTRDERAPRSRCAALICVFLLAMIDGAARAADLFPFTPPWDDASPSATNISSWLESPAGKHGFVAARDGHLFAGEKRIRFFGVNVCFGANFPRKEDAPKIAGRMAKFGINCVRFHHMDMFSAPAGIFAKDGRTLDPERLDRLDFFIAELKKQGIYADLNLHVSRTYPDRPKSEKQGNPNYDKGVDNFSAPMIALQKEFARDLLTHVNPYTGNAYVNEPAVALIEINNENALLFEWRSGGLDNIAAPYRAELGRLWTK
ncbi:MAG: cellulase family glycosylhydrolase, partial [Verrucomicrobiota bacterium]|nr:cellulase family glycosylhydrolase [Verrucomicrobiota bacterium]